MSRQPKYSEEERKELASEGNYCSENGVIGSLDLGPCPTCYGEGFYYDHWLHKSVRCENSVRKEQEAKNSQKTINIQTQEPDSCNGNGKAQSTEE
jgi:hypothetical protein